MRIHLIPPPPHPTILYGLTFPGVLSLPGFSPNATISPAWSSQLQILTSILQLEPPSSIHMLDRGVGLVARVQDIYMDVPQKEIEVKFVDGRVIILPMSSDCVRMLLDVAVDVKGCSESESQRSSMEGGAYPRSTTGSLEDPLPSPTKPSKPGKHKRQRSLLFSLISSLVPKSFSSPPPPPSVPPSTPLPPLPTSRRVSPVSPQRPSFASAQPHPEFLRKRARATLIDVWRRHIVSALTPQHLPPAGYIEWTLLALAGEARAEIDSFKSVRSHREFRVGSIKAGGNRHRKTQSEGRRALDFGDRSLDCESQQWRCRAPSPYQGIFEGEDSDRVLYPRREQADEWGVRYVHNLSPPHEAGHFLVDYDHYADNLLGEPFAFGDDRDDNERLTFELGLVGRYDNDTIGRLSNFSYEHRHPGAYDLTCNDDVGSGLADTGFDLSRTPLIPSDINDDGESDDSHLSLRTPEEGEELPLAPPVCSQHGSATSFAPQPGLVSRVASSRPHPRSRVASNKFPSPNSPESLPRMQTTPLSSSAHSPRYRDLEVEELVASRVAYLDRICAALDIVRGRAHEEGWRQFKATMIGARNGWMDVETERSLEVKAKRRAWSSGIKISAPYSCPSRPVWDGGFSTYRPSTRSPGFTSSARGNPRVRGPIVPTGLSLGIPVRSSPLAMYVRSAEDVQTISPSKYGDLGLRRSAQVIEVKRTPRVHFADSVTKLFPVCEDESEDALESTEVTAVGFPQGLPVSVSADEVEVPGGLADNEEDALCFCPTQPRVRTTSMYVGPPTSSPPSLPALPIFRPSTPPPTYQAAVGGDDSATAKNGEGRLDTSALLLQPLSSLSISSSQQSPLRPSLIPNPPFVPRPRAVSLPTARSYPHINTTRRISDQHGSERCEDLSQAYASPPPVGPLVISATPAPHEQYPRYAHVHSPIPSNRRSIAASILGRTGKEVVFEQDGSEFAVGIEVALGRAEEGRVVW